LIRRLAAIAVFCLLPVAAVFPATAQDRPRLEREFAAWLAGPAWESARKAGVSRTTFDKTISGLSLDWSLPDLRPPGAPVKKAPTRQAEFSSPGRYFSEKNIATLAALGRQRLESYAGVLDEIERTYGVPRRILIAIWGRESAYGRASVPHDAIRVLATQAFMGRRKALFADEFTAALKMLDQGLVTRGHLRSSWAGALGQPQFLPSKFLLFAVDFDRDGERDIWNSVPDTLASIANFLRANGWQPGRDWGFEAIVPDSVSCALEGPEQGRPVAEWIGKGVGRVAGRAFPDGEKDKTGFLLMPAGRLGPAFIATPNFYVLKSFNESDLYALFIGHLADRFTYDRPFRASWEPVSGFYREDVRQMQLRLEKEGHDVGGADGLIGFKTRIAVGLWQQRAGKPATCFPDARLVGTLR
jgi:lytic murein transglycosylase